VDTSCGHVAPMEQEKRLRENHLGEPKWLDDLQDAHRPGHPAKSAQIPDLLDLALRINDSAPHEFVAQIGQLDAVAHLVSAG
jgi:hypothetical protein